MYDIMTPGPTQVRENVRQARALACTNPDLDADFYDFYKETCEEISELLYTKNETLILDGEGILGLEAACATLTEKGDRVLVMDNGEYGKGFAGFVTMYGGEPVLYSTDYRSAFDVKALEEYLEKDHDFKYAALVHCDTPSGMLNDVSKLCPLLKKYGILTLVDSVSAMFGEEMRVDDYRIDLLCGGSQKAVSAPPGLSFVTISDDAYKAMRSRKTPVASFYANILAFDGYYEKQWFPYTMPINEIIGLDRAIDNILEEKLENVLARHEKIASATRKAFTEYGLKLYLESGYSNTVTAVEIPENIGALNLTKHMLEKYNTLVSTSLCDYKDKLLRIGHMGENANLELIIYVLNIIDKSLKDLGFNGNGSLVELFNKHYFNLLDIDFV